MKLLTRKRVTSAKQTKQVRQATPERSAQCCAKASRLVAGCHD